MEIVEAIRTRKSIRKFTPTPVPKKTIREILEIASRAPSAENTQPWEFIVVSGEVLDTLRQKNVEKVRNFEFPPEEMSHLMIERPKGSVFRNRQIEIAKQLFSLMEIPRKDMLKRAEWLERGFRYFDAPAAIIIVAEKTLSIQGTYLDVGSVTQNICLAALAYGLHTCIENQGITYSDVIRKVAGIPDSKRLTAAIAIGYPDWDFPANQVQSEREPIDHIITWRG
ncbi:MAG: nitroreductase [Desulfobacteraceae bacterium]|nr:MAG: nitroreductase [Desulfobacteraceae bacterium]